jgi:NADPH:quinone reductase-like Zn-dependent oxidoreductase
MKAYRIASYDGPAGLRLTDEAAPNQPVGRQVLVRVRASSINFRDLLDIQGELARYSRVADRRIPLCDGVGDVVAVGPDVRRVKNGDRVAAVYHPRWMAGPPPHDLNSLGRGAEANDGMLTEYTKVDESELVHFPKHLSYEEAAGLPCAGVTAWWSLFGPATLMPGEFVLVQGTGGVSIFALQFARAVNARVIATTTSPSKAHVLHDLGAEAVIDAANRVDWSSAVLDATGGVGVDLAVNIAGGDSFDMSVKAVRQSGRLVMVGQRDGGLENINGRFMERGLNIHCTRVGSRENFEHMNRALEATNIKPVIDRVFHFDEAPAAFEYFASAKHIGKVVISH